MNLTTKTPRSASDLFLGALLLAVLCLLAVPTFADDSGPNGFGDFVDVELVNVEVWVTDKNGNPVDGLPREAFRVVEDGQDKDLAFFAEVRGGRRAGTEVVEAVQRAEPLTTSPAEPAAEGTAERTDSGHLVLYFDDLHLSKQGRLGAVDELRPLLDSPSIDPARILILRQDQAIYVEAPFGSSREQIDEALARLAEPRSGQGSQPTDRQAALRYLESEWRIATQLSNSNPNGAGPEAGCDRYLRRVLPYIQNESQRWQAKVNTSVEHLYATSGFLSAIPGVKSLVYVSDSLETTPGSSLQAFVDGLCQTSVLGRRMPDTAGALGEAFRRLSRNASANRVTFYGLQTGGMRVNSALSAENEVLDLRSSNRYQNELRLAERAGMQYLAAETGGRAIFNQNDLTRAALAIADDTSSYYSLAYSPDHVGEGREHKIRVELTDQYDRRGLRVRHRKGYQHKPAEARLAEKLQAALFMGFGDNTMSVKLGAGAPAPSALAKAADFYVPLHIYVPVRSVTFFPTADATEAKIFVQVAWRDTSGGKHQVRHKTWTIKGPAAEDSTFDLKMDLEMSGGLSTVAVAVRDELSREVSFVSTSVALPTKDQLAEASAP